MPCLSLMLSSRDQHRGIDHGLVEFYRQINPNIPNLPNRRAFCPTVVTVWENAIRSTRWRTVRKIAAAKIGGATTPTAHGTVFHFFFLSLIESLRLPRCFTYSNRRSTASFGFVHSTYKLIKYCLKNFVLRILFFLINIPKALLQRARRNFCPPRIASQRMHAWKRKSWTYVNEFALKSVPGLSRVIGK